MPSLLLLFMGMTLCLTTAGATAASSSRAAAPPLQVTREGQTLRATWGDALVLELRGNRFLRFLGSPAHDLWIGTDSHPIDLGWA